MARTYQVVSGDGHLEWPPDMWQHRVPSQYRDRAPRLIRMADGGDAWVIEGKDPLTNGLNLCGGKAYDAFSPVGVAYRRPDGTATPGTGSAAQRLAEQDTDGVDCEVLYPALAGPDFYRGIKERQAYLAIVQAYNSFLAEEYCAVAPDRLIGVGITPETGIEDAVAELRRCKRTGLRAMNLRMWPSGKPNPTSEDDRFWATALESEMRVAPHGNFGGGAKFDRAKALGAERFGATLNSHMAARCINPSYTLCQMMTEGVFDRFPNLRVYFAESFAAWVPWVMQTMDDKYLRHHHWAGINLKKKPSQYIRDHVIFGIVRDPLALKLRDIIGVENLIWGSDFPHSAGDWPHSRRVIGEIFASVPEREKRQVLVENAAAFFGLDTEKALTPTPAA
ncbi:MAG: amidohydrolase family protein [Chloroflexi bacterium]|nr:amidohydrolase family protein [Chloroflexota bacterium]